MDRKKTWFAVNALFIRSSTEKSQGELYLIAVNGVKAIVESIFWIHSNISISSALLVVGSTVQKSLLLRIKQTTTMLVLS